MKKMLFPLVVVGLIYVYQQSLYTNINGENFAPPEMGAGIDDRDWEPGSPVRGKGTVARILSDDTEGSRHQRFILELPSGRTVLVAHNIDLAPRVKSLSVGDTVEFFGEYETNDRGGVIHWTHHDPNGKHFDGWLRHNDKGYQ